MRGTKVTCLTLPIAITLRRMHFAYIDPGAGSLLVQAVIAAIVSVPFFFRRTFVSVVQRIRATRDRENSQPKAGESEG